MVSRKQAAERAANKLRMQARKDAEIASDDRERLDPDQMEEAFEVTTGAKTAKSEDKESWRKV